MAYTDNYRKYLEEIPGDIRYCEETNKKIVFGYTSDLDIIFPYEEKAFNQLLEQYLKEKPSVKAEDSIDDLSDLARIASAYMLEGAGGEVDITSLEVCEYMRNYFSGTPGLGGTCAQGAAALSAMGMPLIAHISDRCLEVCKLMDRPGLFSVKGKELVPILETASAEEPVYHMILQYTKGDQLKVDGSVQTVPCSNRLIMDYDTIHKDLNVLPDFRSYLEDHAEDMVSYNISGLNGIIDVELAKKRLDELDSHYRTIKEKNPDCIFYFESAHYLSPKVKYTVYQKMSKYIDILGMNEEELVAHTREFQQEIDKDSLPDVIRGMDLILEKYDVNGIILHTKDYSMYYGKELKGVNLEKGLTMGNLMSGTRARKGIYGSQEDCRENLQLALSETGVRFAQELAEMELRHSACLVPSRYLEKPRYTIGLGDTFVAGVQLGFVRS